MFWVLCMISLVSAFLRAIDTPLDVETKCESNKGVCCRRAGLDIKRLLSVPTGNASLAPHGPASTHIKRTVLSITFKGCAGKVFLWLCIPVFAGPRQFTADRTSRFTFPIVAMAVLLIISMSRKTQRSTHPSTRWIPRLLSQKQRR
jgi:hypothetical protein